MSDNRDLKVGDILEWGEEKYPMQCVFRTIMNERTYVLLHPTDAPDDIQFVPMRLKDTGVLKPETNRSVCEAILRLYSQFRERKAREEQ